MTEAAAELKKVVKQLQSSSNPSEIIAILNKFKNEYEVTEAILRVSAARTSFFRFPILVTEKCIRSSQRGC